MQNDPFGFRIEALRLANSTGNNFDDRSPQDTGQAQAAGCAATTAIDVAQWHEAMAAEAKQFVQSVGKHEGDRAKMIASLHMQAATAIRCGTMDALLEQLKLENCDLRRG